MRGAGWTRWWLARLWCITSRWTDGTIWPSMRLPPKGSWQLCRSVTTVWFIHFHLFLVFILLFITASLLTRGSVRTAVTRGPLVLDLPDSGMVRQRGTVFIADNDVNMICSPTEPFRIPRNAAIRLSFISMDGPTRELLRKLLNHSREMTRIDWKNQFFMNALNKDIISYPYLIFFSCYHFTC